MKRQKRSDSLVKEKETEHKRQKRKDPQVKERNLNRREERGVIHK